MRTGSTVYPSERNNYSTTKYSETDSDSVFLRADLDSIMSWQFPRDRQPWW